MKQPKTFLLLSIVVAVLVLGIAYAAITSVTLNLTGNVQAEGEQASFVVGFVGTPDVDIPEGIAGYVTASGNVNDRLNATIDVSGLKKKDDSVTVTYDISNDSTDLWAGLEITKSILNGDDAKFFTLSSELGDDRLSPGQATTLVVTITLNQTPLDNVEATVDIGIEATPRYNS